MVAFPSLAKQQAPLQAIVLRGYFALYALQECPDTLKMGLIFFPSMAISPFRPSVLWF
jgi:hypothetical protein